MIILGLCICYNNNNYGTMLQAYATTVALENMGIAYEIIRYKKKPTPRFILKSLPRLLNPILLHEKKLVLQKKWHLKINKAFAARSGVKDAAFGRFQNSRFRAFSPVYYGYGELVRNAAKYDACLVGSDQLWSPSGLPTNFYNLRFVPDGIRRISYAASFGVSSIPFFQKRRTRDFLRRIDYLSVRENSAREIIQSLTGVEAKVVADPTMLLTVQDWERLIPPENPQSEPYMFAYFLGANPKHREAVTALAKRLGLRLVALRHMDEFVSADENFGDDAPYDVGPEQFLNLIRHARYVCTDSFHGSVFSVLHHRQFVVLRRFRDDDGTGNSRNSRVESLCWNLGLSARLCALTDNLEDILTTDIDYDAVDEKLMALRGESLDFLKESLAGLEGRV